MPSYITHHVFSNAAEQISGDTIAHIASLYPDAYHWGAQGPDPLYYYHAPFNGTIGAAAEKIHSGSAADFFEALCVSAMKQHDSAALSYVFGFCTHYALERVTHAYIEAWSAILSNALPEHTLAACKKRIEQAIDCYMIEHYFSASALSFDINHLLDPHAAECTVLSRVLSASAKMIPGIRLSPAAIYRALQDMHRALQLASSRSVLQKRFTLSKKLAAKSKYFASIISANEPLPIDAANQNHAVWIAANDSERTDSFHDLFSAAIPLAVSLQRAVLNRYYQQKPLDPRFFPTNFYGEKIKL